MGIGALQAAVSGLKVAQKAIDVTSRNIANTQTPGYTRKILPQETLIAGADPIGVFVLPEIRNLDADLQRDYFRASGDVASLQVQDAYLERVQAIYGKPEEEGSIAHSLSKLNDSFVELAASPEEDVYLRATVERARQTARTFNNTSTQLTAIRNDVQDAMAISVDEINAQLSDIARLNTRIALEQAGSNSTADLEDQRDEAIRLVAEQMDITSFKRSDGMIVVQTRTGQTLADGQARQLFFDPTPLSPASFHPTSAAPIRLNDPTTGTDLIPGGLGGRLGGLVELRDTILPRQQAQIDELAHKTALRFDAQNLTLFTDTAGVIPADAPPAYVGFAAQIQVNTTVAGDPTLLRQGTGGGPAVDPGDNTVMLNVINFTFGPFQDAAGTAHVPFRATGVGPDLAVTTRLPTAATLEEYSRALITDQATEHADIIRRADFEESYRDTLERRLLNESGVDVDIEVSRLIELQQNYAAAARMVQTVDQLFQELLNSI